MAEQVYDYVIIGGGLTGASAVEGIREIDPGGSILLVGKEKHLPYHRPPLSKKLWSGQKTVEEIYVRDREFYTSSAVDVALGVEITLVDLETRRVAALGGSAYGFNKLLIATGGLPRTLNIPGGDIDGVCYYRYLDDYLNLRSEASRGKSAVVIGGGFIGAEMAAALNSSKVAVAMIFPEQYVLSRILPHGLGRAVQDDYIRRGVVMLAGRTPASIEKHGGRFVTTSDRGETVESDMVIVGIGIRPSTDLADAAGLAVDNGIAVNEKLQTSDPSIYAAGDNALFPYSALGQRTRVEHWDNALNQGKHAGLNMAGADKPFTYMPYFFSDLFDFGFEAVGDVDSRLDTLADWQEEHKTGVVYYLRDGRVRGAMMCNVWDKVEAARELIATGVGAGELRGAIA